MHASTYITNCRRSFFFFQLPNLGYDFMIADLARLNLAILKTSETSQEHTCGGVLC